MHRRRKSHRRRRGRGLFLAGRGMVMSGRPGGGLFMSGTGGGIRGVPTFKSLLRPHHFRRGGDLFPHSFGLNG